jgi:hypothetical protein
MEPPQKKIYESGESESECLMQKNAVFIINTMKIFFKGVVEVIEAEGQG